MQQHSRILLRRAFFWCSLNMEGNSGWGSEATWRLVHGSSPTLSNWGSYGRWMAYEMLPNFLKKICNFRESCEYFFLTFCRFFKSNYGRNPLENRKKNIHEFSCKFVIIRRKFGNVWWRIRRYSSYLGVLPFSLLRFFFFLSPLFRTPFFRANGEGERMPPTPSIRFCLWYVVWNKFYRRNTIRYQFQ